MNEGKKGCCRVENDHSDLIKDKEEKVVVKVVVNNTNPTQQRSSKYSPVLFWM
jgi:hypothetical protein